MTKDEEFGKHVAVPMLLSLKRDFELGHLTSALKFMEWIKMLTEKHVKEESNEQAESRN